MNRFLQQLYMAAGHWVSTACPVQNDELSYKMLDKVRQKECTCLAGDALPLMADRMFMEKAFTGAKYAGAKQLVMVHTGYDTFAVRHSLWYDGIQVFDMNPTDIVRDKQRRILFAGEKNYSNIHSVDCDDAMTAPAILARSGMFDINKTAFIYVSDLPVHIGNRNFEKFLGEISEIITPGSSVVFSFKNTPEGYNYKQLEKMLSDKGFHIYEYMTARQLHKDYMENFEILNNRKFYLVPETSYCVAVKKIK